MLRLRRWKQRGSHLATARLAVRQRTPWRTRVLGVLLLMAFFGVATYVGYLWGQQTMGVHNAKLVPMHASENLLQGADQQRSSELQSLRQKLVSTEQQLKLELSTRDTITRQLQQYQTDNTGLREQLAFYESLLTKTDRAPGLTINAFNAELLSPGHYRLKVVLVQGQSSQEAFKGTVDFKLTVEKGDKRETLVWPSHPLPLTVARFGHLETDTALVGDARLRQVEVRIYAGAETQVKLAHSYEVKG